MRSPAILAAAALALGLAASPAQADIIAEDAIRIARENGVATVTELDREDGNWEVEGRDADGRRIEVYIDIATGNVIKVERD